MRPFLRLTVLAALVAAIAAYLRRRGGGSMVTSGAHEGLEYDGPAGGGDPAEAGGGTPDDARLRDRVASELFRDPDLPKGDIVLDAVAGVVTLRGAVEERLVEEIGARAAAVEGVERVENLLHPHDAPPPG